jgi:hypothetical protein
MNTSIGRRRFKKACSKAAVSESLRGIIPVRQGLSNARTKLKACFNILREVVRHV